MSDAPRRSRFDQTEPSRSRFDRRSRSPVRRSRSPAAASSPSTVGGKNDNAKEDTKSPSAPAVTDPKLAAAAAAAAAARINAQLKEKAKSMPTQAPIVTKQLPKKDSAGIYSENGDYQKDIEINHMRNRYTLTKGAFQAMVKTKTGADVTTKGVYVPEGGSAITNGPPLYLQVTAQTEEALKNAVEMIEEQMKEELPNLIDERRFRTRREPEENFERDELGRRKWPDERIPIPLEPIPGFNLRAQVVGHQGSYVKYIQAETSCRVQIKGRGSGFIESDTGVESDEQMYLHVSGRQKEMVDRAVVLAKELLNNVKTEYDNFKANGPRHRGTGGHRQNSMGGGGPPGGGYGNHGPPSGQGGYGGGGYNNNNNYHAGGYGTPGAPPPPPPPGGNSISPPPPPPPTDAQSPMQGQYGGYYPPAQGYADPNADPYAQYGGYETYMQYYEPYLRSQMQTQGQAQSPPPGQAQGQERPDYYGAYPSPAPGYNAPSYAGIQNILDSVNRTPSAGAGYAAAPPPPGSAASGGAPPPPPPPPDAGGYNAVPPPPGM